MMKRKSTYLNTMFLICSTAGSFLIFFQDKYTAAFAYSLPAGVVFYYGITVKLAVKKINDYDLTEHYTESIYFLGFLFTLISLAALFYKFSSEFFSLNSTEQIQQTFQFIGISVTTSISGVLMRNILRPGILERFKSEDDSLEKSYEILKKIAGDFSAGYKNTFDNLQIFLEERRNNAALLDSREKEYLAALDGFVDATRNFTKDLKAADKALVDHVGFYSKTAEMQANSIVSLNKASNELALSTSNIRSDIEMIPMADVSDNIRTLGEETGELNAVIDSLLEVMTRKLEKIG